MPFYDLIPNPSPRLIALARWLRLQKHGDYADEAAIDYRCGRRPCKRPGRCKVRNCRRNSACQLATLAGWPWPIEGHTFGSFQYNEELNRRFDRLGRLRQLVHEVDQDASR